MRFAILPLLALIAGALFTGLNANADDFTLSIMGHEPGIDISPKAEELPIVFCPKSGLHPLNGYYLDQVSEHCFFLVIQNVQTVPITIKMDCSAWHESVQFKITDGSGKSYTVEHQPIDWSANPMVTWSFAAKERRTMPIDFTNGAMVGWQGLPSPAPIPAIVTMTATFTYYDTVTGKSVGVSSQPTKVILK
jgi:hypothetical protein